LIYQADDSQPEHCVAEGWTQDEKQQFFAAATMLWVRLGLWVVFGFGARFGTDW
jgi:hypothetical protein